MTAKKNLIAFLIIGISGTLLHFVYELSGKNMIVALFAPINESIWEHQKLLYVPSILYMLCENKILKHKPNNYLIASVLGIIMGIISIIILFYTYSGILGFSVTAVDILLFYIGVFITLAVRNTAIKNRLFYNKDTDFTAYTVAAVLFCLFSLWTFFPPDIALFREI